VSLSRSLLDNHVSESFDGVVSEREPEQRCALQNYAFQELDELFYQSFRRGIVGEQEEPPHCSGSTVLAALLQGPQLMVANAGDSRAVISKRGRAEDLSRDHRPALDSEHERVKRCGELPFFTSQWGW